MPRRLLWLAVPIVLGACGNPFGGYAPTHAEILDQAWIGPEVAYTPPPLYCYRTLAEPECRAAPQPGEEDRLVGSHGGPSGPQPR